MWGADNTSTSSIELTKLFGPSRSKETTVRALVVAVVTPIPKAAWLTRWPSSRVDSTLVTSGAAGGRDDTVRRVLCRYCGCFGGVIAGVAGHESADDRRFGR